MILHQMCSIAAETENMSYILVYVRRLLSRFALFLLTFFKPMNAYYRR